MISSMTFRCADSTELMNKISETILPAGVYTFPGFDTSSLPNQLAISNQWIFPSISSSGTGYQVTVKGPWIVRNIDGMTIREDFGVDHRIDFPGPDNYYVGLLAKYLVSTDPILELRYITLADYANWSEKAYFIIFAQVNIPVSATHVDMDMINIDARIRPRGTLFLTEDAFNAGSILRVVTDTSNFPPVPGAHELVYVRSENALYFNDSNNGSIPNWVRVDNPLKGISTFNPVIGRTIALPLIAFNKDYMVNIIELQSSGGNLGEVWVERGPLSFIVKNTGTAAPLIAMPNTYGSPTMFMWQVLV